MSSVVRLRLRGVISKTSRMKGAEKVLEHNLVVTFLKSLMMTKRSGRLFSLNCLDGGPEYDDEDVIDGKVFNGVSKGDG